MESNSTILENIPNAKKHSWIYKGVEKHIFYSVYNDVFTGLHFTTLLGGEFPNTYGQGKSEEQAIASLKIRLHQLWNRKNNI